MDFDEILAQVLYLLQRDKRVSYWALKYRFKLDDDYLEALKDEIIEAKQQAIDENGKVLVWTGSPEPPPDPTADVQVVSSVSSAILAPLLPPEPLASEVQPASPEGPHTQPTFTPALHGKSQAERRRLTVMFCDLVDSTSLSGQLDPEDLREVVRAYQATCAEVVQRFEGYIAQYLGDSLLIYYGYPQAHEDDAPRAIRTGLGILEVIKTLNARLAHEYGVRLSVRIGIHTGLVVVGEMGGGDRHEWLALGETPNVAARMQAVAAPDTVVISAVMYRLTQGYFTCQDLGLHTLKGMATPMGVYRVLQESEAKDRFEVAVRAGLSPLIGRDKEVELLLRCWEQCQAERGKIVLLGGEAGIGKSRLVKMLQEKIAPAGCPQIVFRCSPYHINSAFYAVIDTLQRALLLRQYETPAKKLEKLEQMLQRCHFPLQEGIPCFASLLSVPLPDERYPPLPLSPQRWRAQTQEALVRWLMAEVQQRPGLVIWEDLHWADPSTIELLDLLMPRIPEARMLLLLTFRPEFRQPWPSHLPLSQMTLGRLERHQVEQMVTHLTHGKAFPPEILQQVIDKTDGVPLFVEELVKMVQESGLVREEEDHYALIGALSPLTIPDTLQGSLMARLDRLGPAREIAQLGAAIGREFTYEVLQAISSVDEMTLQRELARLVDAELVYQRELPPRARYTFKHMLIQETAYQSLLRSTRQDYHQRIARVLAGRFPAFVETQPELLAHHYTEAGLHEEAISYWHLAGQCAIERSANLEAISHLTKGLEVLATLPDSAARDQRELTLQLALGAPLLMIKGYTAPEVERLYMRAQELSTQEGESPQRFSVLVGLWRFYLARANFQKARDLAEQCFLLAQHVQNAVLLQEAYLMLGSTLFYLGEIVSARAYLEQGMALYDPQHSRARTFSSGNDPGVVCLSRLAWTLWMLGYPQQAIAKVDEALALAQELSHAYSLAFAVHYAAVLRQSRREAWLAQQQAEATLALAREHGFVYWSGGGRCVRGWALADQGAVVEGIAELRQGFTIWQTLGVVTAQTHMLVRLAEAYSKAGQVEAGLQALDEAFRAAQSTMERYYEAEIHRLRGELLLQGSRTLLSPDQSQALQAAEGSFLQALEVARYQQAKSLELRAVMSMSRLWQQQGKRAEARQLLAETYTWFTEGFETPDLQDAKALLEALA